MINVVNCAFNEAGLWTKSKVRSTAPCSASPAMRLGLHELNLQGVMYGEPEASRSYWMLDRAQGVEAMYC